MQKELFLNYIFCFLSLDAYANIIIDKINLFIQVKAILWLVNLSAETLADLLVEKPAEIPPKRLLRSLY